MTADTACPECGADTVTRNPGALPVCTSCDWTGWEPEPEVQHNDGETA